MPTNQSICQCCGHDCFIEVVSFDRHPVSGILRSSIFDHLAIQELVFEVCESCGLMRNRMFSAPPDYSEKPRSTSRQLPSYHNYLLGLVGDLADEHDLIVEIGANDGTFLDLLREQGYINIYGVEPSDELVKCSRGKGHKIVADYFGQDIVGALIKDFGVPKLIICRHTLEHVPNPDIFVQALRGLLADGKGTALVEVPDSTAIPEGINFVELWDEHLFYFTPFTLSLLMKRHGLRIVSEMLLPHLETRNILFQVTSATSYDHSTENSAATNEVFMWRSFSERFQTISEQIRYVVRASPKPIYLIGASHPQCNFVNYLDLESFVGFMIDDDSSKVGKLPPVSSNSIQIINTEEFSLQAQGGTLILTGFGYQSWSQKLCDIACSKGLQVIDPRKLS